MWSKKGSPVAQSVRPEPSTSISMVMSVSAVRARRRRGSCGGCGAHGVQNPTAPTRPWSRFRPAVPEPVSRAPRRARRGTRRSRRGVPSVTRRQSVRPGHDGAVAHQHRSLDELRPHVLAGTATWPEQDEVGRRRPLVDRQLVERRGDPAALLDESGDARAHLVEVVEREDAGELLQRVEVVRQHDLLELLHAPGRPDQVPEPQRRGGPGLGVGAADHHRAVLGDQRQRRPRGELPVRLVDHQQPVDGLDRVEHRAHRRLVLAPGRSGCWASTGR